MLKKKKEKRKVYNKPIYCEKKKKKYKKEEKYFNIYISYIFIFLIFDTFFLNILSHF